MSFDCGWASCTAKFDNKEEILPHLSNLHMSANHLKPNKVEEEGPQVKCKWSSCGQEKFNSVDDLIKHISFNHLEMSLEEMQNPNLCFWRNCGQRFKDFESLTVMFTEYRLMRQKCMLGLDCMSMYAIGTSVIEKGSPLLKGKR
jgi:predicted small metal-binding protein